MCPSEVATGEHEAFRESWPILREELSAQARPPIELITPVMSNNALDLALEDLRLATGSFVRRAAILLPRN